VSIPGDNEELKQLVTRVQTHSHSVACKKKKSDDCRFRFPKPPSDKTIISHPPDDDMHDIESFAKGKTEILTKVYEAIQTRTLPCDMTLDSLLSDLGISVTDYHHALSIGVKGRTYIPVRKPDETCINNYNPTILSAWQANIDIQPTPMHVLCTLSRTSPRARGKWVNCFELQKKELSNSDIKIQMKKIGTTFLTHREVSAQEAAYRLLSLPMISCNVKRIFVSADLAEERIRVLKPLFKLQELSPESEDVYIQGIHERYASRPDSLTDLCLADFAVEYDSCNKPKQCDNDALPEECETETTKCKKITLKNKMGTMVKRSRRAIM
jgi:hypothetical protein